MKKRLAKILWKLYSATLPKTSWKDGMNMAFHLQGHNYYAYDDYSKLPPERLKRYQQTLSMIDKGFSPDEYKNMVGLAKHCAQNCLDNLAQNKKMESMQALIHTLTELDSRREDILFHPHLLMEIAAIVIIRDDEKTPNEINEEIHKAKAELFLVRGGELDFFTINGIGKYIPNSIEFLTGYKEQLEIALKQNNLSKTTFDKIAGEVGYSR